MYRTTLAATLLAGAVALGSAAPAVACPDPDHQTAQGSQGAQAPQDAHGSHDQSAPEPIQAHTDPLKVSEPATAIPAFPGTKDIPGSQGAQDARDAQGSAPQAVR